MTRGFHPKTRDREIGNHGSPGNMTNRYPLVTSRQAVLSTAGLVFALGFASLPISRWENEFASVAHLVGYEVVWWAAVALVLSFVISLEQRPLASIGLRTPNQSDIVSAVIAGVVAVAGLAIIYYLVFPLLHATEDQRVRQLIATPFWWRFISVIRAAVAEEVLFRGYAIERIEELTGSSRIAALLSWVIFTIEHVGPWAWSHVLIAGFGGIVLTILYLRRRNLWANIIAHFIVDGLAVLPG